VQHNSCTAYSPQLPSVPMQSVGGHDIVKAGLRVLPANELCGPRDPPLLKRSTMHRVHLQGLMRRNIGPQRTTTTHMACVPLPAGHSSEQSITELQALTAQVTHVLPKMEHRRHHMR
jgi:hypothetical protein